MSAAEGQQVLPHAGKFAAADSTDRTDIWSS